MVSAADNTPTLRGLSRTGPYFHDGSATRMEPAVFFHLDGGRWNEYLNPVFRDPKKKDTPLTGDEPNQELEDLVLFLRALDGEEVDKAVGSPVE